MQTFFQDLRFGARMLRKQPGFTVIAIITLALGIGATTAIFSLVNSVLLRPLPFAEADRIVALGQTWPQSRENLSALSYRNFADLRAQNRSFENLSAYYPNTFTLTGEAKPLRLIGTVATHDFFAVLRVSPVLGRTFVAADDEAGGGPDAVPMILSHQLWQKNFGGDQNVLGRKIKLSGNDYTVIGVMPAGFAWPVMSPSVDVWTSLALDARQTGEGSILQARGWRTWEAMGRLKAGVTIEQARAELDALAKGIERQFPKNNKDAGISAQPMISFMVGDLSKMLTILFGAVLCVLLIACTNVANLLTVRAAARRREIAIRAAMGAGQGRIVRQLLTESLLLSLIGGGLGLMLAVWGADGLRAIAPTNIPRLNETGIDWRVLLFVAGVSLLNGTLFGLLPAWQAARTDLNTAFKDGSATTSEGRGRRRLRGALVTAELALSLVLLTGAGLLLQSFMRLQRVDPGFDPNNLTTFNIELSSERFEKAEPAIAFFRDLQERLKTLPGVASVGMASFLPLGGSDPSTGFEIKGQAADEKFNGGIRIITPDYLRTMGIPLKQGRDFTDRDTLTSSPVVLINQAFAKQFFPHESPLGKFLKPSFGTYHLPSRDFEIIGIVGDVRHEGLRNDAPPEFYLANAQMPFGAMTVIVRGDIQAHTLIPTATDIVTELDKDTAIFGVRTLNEERKLVSGDGLFSAPRSKLDALKFDCSSNEPNTYTELLPLVTFWLTCTTGNREARASSKRASAISRPVAVALTNGFVFSAISTANGSVNASDCACTVPPIGANRSVQASKTARYCLLLRFIRDEELAFYTQLAQNCHHRTPVGEGRLNQVQRNKSGHQKPIRMDIHAQQQGD